VTQKLYGYFFVSNIIAQVKDTRRPNNIGANTIPSLVTAKYTNNSKEKNNETSIVIFTILRHLFLGLMKGHI